MLILGSQTVSIDSGLLSPWATGESSLLIDPVTECRHLVTGQQTALPLHNGHVELQSSQRDDTLVSFDEGV